MTGVMNVESSMLKQLGYLRTTKTLVVRFNNDSVYVYKGVPQHVWDELQAADSMGKYFNQHIRMSVPYERQY
jgi:hypothetical protein